MALSAARNSLSHHQMAAPWWCLRVVNNPARAAWGVLSGRCKIFTTAARRAQIIAPKVADGEDDQSNCGECGDPLAPDQRYCLNCGHRRGELPGAVAGTVGALTSKGGGPAAAAAAAPKPPDAEEGWSWMPSPQAIAIAVIGMLALGVGLGSAMSEIASSAPLQTILLEYPQHATEAPPAAEPEEEVEEEEEVEAVIAEGPAETALPEEIAALPLPEEVIEAPEEPLEGSEEPEPAPFNPFEEPEVEGEEPMPEIKHAWLIVLGENSYEGTYGAAAAAPYLTRVLPKKGTLIPNYYGVTGGVLANEIALLSGQGPTRETSANCPDYTAIAPGTVSETAEQVEGNGCVYPKEVKTLPTELEEKELTWRAYVEDMENGGAVGQPWRCRKPTLGGPDSSPAPSPGDQYATWRNPVVFFGAVTEGEECEKHDVGFEVLTRDLSAKKKTPALSLIFPDACHSGGEVECEPGAATGATGAVQLLKNLVPAIMASPAYEEGGGLIMITSAQAPQAGEHPDPSACCLAPTYPNLPPPAASTDAHEESVVPSGGGGKVGLLLISPLVKPETVEELEYANHFTLLKTLAGMFGVEPPGYAAEEEVPTLDPELFAEEEAAETAAAE
jgi:phosphatidylinositol-3-phosphatase